MKIWTYAEVREKIQEEMDLQEETFVSEQEYLDYTNEAIDSAEANIHSLYQDYFLTSQVIPLVALQKNYDLPSDIYANKIRYIQFKNGGMDCYEIRRIKISDVKFVDPTSTNVNYRFNIENSTALGRKLALYPTPPSSDPTSVTMWYLRNAATVAADADTIDIPEFIEYIFAYIRVKIARKEISPLTQNYEIELEAQKNLMREVLDDMIPNEETNIALDMTFYNDFDGYDYGSNF